MPKYKCEYLGGFFPENELRRREVGFKRSLGWEDSLYCALYSALGSYDPHGYLGGFSEKKPSGLYGGIFNLEFSPDGKQLVAACENKALLVFDPLTKKLIYDLPRAHAGCVNGIKFLDNRLFATCSDDKTVALWDLRNMRHKVACLRGHTHWVKNIEYSDTLGMLVTSGFDGRILGWNINRYNENSSKFVELFKMNGLMRTRITPDLSKLVICTTAGYIMVIHDLNLTYLASDLKGFQPNMYQMSHFSEEFFSRYPKIKKFFHSTRNRIEFISDFPSSNIAEIIHSLQVHPQGWCILSRNTSFGDISEWTCVHDIQTSTVDEEAINSNKESNHHQNVDSETENPQIPLFSASLRSFSTHTTSNARQTDNNSTQELVPELTFNSTPSLNIHSTDNPEDSSTSSSEDELDELFSASFRRFNRRNIYSNRNFAEGEEIHYIREHFRNRRLRISSTLNDMESRQNDIDRMHDALMFLNSDELFTSQSSSHSHAGGPPLYSQENVHTSESNGMNRQLFFIQRPISSAVVLPSLQNARFVGMNSNSSACNSSQNRSPYNIPRLSHFIEEPNKGKGFIKELCFSQDGRVICSPYDSGIRLLAFDENCSELSHCIEKDPRKLNVISSYSCHTNTVVSTKFSPNDCLLVSGCLDGKLIWHQPVL